MLLNRSWNRAFTPFRSTSWPTPSTKAAKTIGAHGMGR